VPRSLRRGPIDLTIRSVRYAVDIDAMTQTNADSGTARTIRRRVHREAAAASAAARPSAGSSGAPIAQGDRVRVKAGVTPSHGWGSVTKDHIGVVVMIDGVGGVTVDFPSQKGWSGVLSEMELVASASDDTGGTSIDEEEGVGVATRSIDGFRGSAWETFCVSPLSAAGAKRERANFMRSFSFDGSSPAREASGGAADAGGTGGSAAAIAAAANPGIMPPAMPMPPSSTLLFKKVTS
jgi:hypothetical protein